MRQNIRKAFKIQSVENSLNRATETSLTDMAETLGISRSALCKGYSRKENLS